MTWVWAVLLFIIYTAAVFAGGVLTVLWLFRRDWERERKRRREDVSEAINEAVRAGINDWAAGLDPQKWQLLTTERLLTTDGDAYIEATRASGS